MIVSTIKRSVLKEYGLGGRSPPDDVSTPKGVELVWNETQWEVYRCEGDTLTWQMTLPFTELTPSAVKNYLQKYDTSEGGALDGERREKDWKRMFQKTIEYSNKRKDTLMEDAYYEIGHMSKWLGRYEEGMRQCVVPINMGMQKVNGKPKKVWAYKKDRRLKLGSDR